MKELAARGVAQLVFSDSAQADGVDALAPGAPAAGAPAERAVATLLARLPE
ncbi:hypothetical protein [Arthrobacter sp. H16F315]|uniref:hypothetical protein n=1 Tax=Arthrobacter sp. H16F315 TaxID=2955314 RepID=UPI0020973971|nr:hypothetical protein [Arthrobacter sp. H16F315]MDD1476044.1 hypothetical protein [Arthrobacter sp. H16F315]